VIVRHWWFILVAAAVGVVAIYLYFSWQPASDLERKGLASDLREWVALGTAVVSFLAALVGLVAKLGELRAKSGRAA
jgi:hypothetical protein